MKKVVAVLLVGVMALTLAGCSQNSTAGAQYLAALAKTNSQPYSHQLVSVSIKSSSSIGYHLALDLKSDTKANHLAGTMEMTIDGFPNWVQQYKLYSDGKTLYLLAPGETKYLALPLTAAQPDDGKAATTSQPAAEKPQDVLLPDPLASLADLDLAVTSETKDIAQQSGQTYHGTQLSVMIPKDQVPSILTKLLWDGFYGQMMRSEIEAFVDEDARYTGTKLTAEERTAQIDEELASERQFFEESMKQAAFSDVQASVGISDAGLIVTEDLTITLGDDGKSEPISYVIHSDLLQEAPQAVELPAFTPENSQTLSQLYESADLSDYED